MFVFPVVVNFRESQLVARQPQQRKRISQNYSVSQHVKG